MEERESKAVPPTEQTATAKETLKTQRVIVFAAVLAAALLFGPFSVPNWAMVAFVVILVPVGFAVCGKQKRMERRIARTLWEAVRRHS
jgi:hypothetical protein